MTGAGGQTAAGTSVVDSPQGPLTAVAGPSTFKPVVYGCIHLLYATVFGLPGALLIYIALTEKSGDDLKAMSAIGLVMGFLGLLTLFAAIRRFRAAGDSRVRIAAGPGGIALAVPSNPGIVGFLRLGFVIQSFDLGWNEIAKWYPFLRTVNGIPTESALIFELSDGRQITAHTMFYNASRNALVAKIEAAMQGPPAA